MITCSKCGKQLADGTKFCDGCGAKIFDLVFCPSCGQKTSTEFAFCQNCGSSIANDNTVEDKKKAAPKKGGKKILGIGVAVVAIILVVAFLVPMIFGAKMPSYVAYVKDSELYFTPDGKKKAIQVTDDLGSTGATAVLAKDGKTMFYVDKYDSDGSSFYCRNVTKKDSDPIKIDNNVGRFWIADSSKLVTYVADGNLYQHNLKDKTTVKKGIDTESLIYVSDNGKKIFFLVKDDEGAKDLYEWNGKEANKVASDVADIEHVTEDFKTVYYTKKGDEGYDLYQRIGNKDSVKIESDIARAVIYDSGDVYFAVADEDDTDIAKLYHYKKEKKEIAKNVVALLDNTPSDSKTPVIVYQTVKDPEEKEPEYEYYTASKDKTNAISIKGEDPTVFDINSKGTKLFYIADEDDGHGDLYSVAISGGKAKTPEKYDSDVYSGEFIDDSDNYLYKKDYDDGVYELYVNKKKIDSDVSGYDADAKLKKIVYYVDYNDGEGTLKTSNFSGKSQKISDDVCQYVLLPNGKIVYRKDLDGNKADLYITGKKDKIKSDVTYIVPVAR